MNIALIPLDERPVNTRYPAMIAEIFGITLHIPPPALLSHFRQPANCAGLLAWLDPLAPTLDGLIVSIEMLGYGSLISSRISHESAATIIGRIEHLRTIKLRCPDLPIFGFNLITRISNANWADEEPLYWANNGEQIYRLSQLLDLEQQMPSTHSPLTRSAELTSNPHPSQIADELTKLRAEVPLEHVQDFLQRRARNHTVNLNVLQLLADDVLDRVVLSSDDTNPIGLPTREKKWLSEWGNYLGLGDRLLMYPGADEVGCALLARMVNHLTASTPAFTVDYVIPGGAEVTAPFEDGPVRLTVERQVRAAGGILLSIPQIVPQMVHDKIHAPRTMHHANLFINPPVTGENDWPHAHESDAQRRPHLAAFVERIITALQSTNHPVILTDVAFANGADPILMELAQGKIDFAQLASFGAWNTAGNTIGVAVAQACATMMTENTAQKIAQQRFLLRHLLEDWGYMSVIRAEVGDWLASTYGSTTVTDSQMPIVCAEIEQRLQSFLDERLPNFARQFRITPRSLRLPWQRLFEIDFELQVVSSQ